MAALVPKISLNGPNVGDGFQAVLPSLDVPAEPPVCASDVKPLYLDFEGMLAESAALMVECRDKTDEFIAAMRAFIADAQMRAKRSRHPRLRSKGRRSRWPRGVRD